MSVRQTPCKKCGDAIVLAAAPNGGVMPLAPYPDPDGRYRVEVLDHLRVLEPGESTSSAVKRYDPHDCVPAGKAVPRGGRPAQLELEEVAQPP